MLVPGSMPNIIRSAALLMLQSYALFSNFARLNRRLKIGFGLAVKLLTTVGLGIYLYSKIAGGAFNINYAPALPLLLVLAFALTPINWFIESLKWKILVAQVEQISTWVAVKSTLSGLASSVITPFRLGDPVGKVLFLNEENRMQGAVLSVAGSMCQLVVTLLVGIVSGVLLIGGMGSSFSEFYNVGIAVAIGAVVLTIASFFLIRKYKPEWLKGLAQLSTPVLTKVMLLSILRYACFIAQFACVFWAYGETKDLVDIGLYTALYFFVAAFVPMFIVVEAGIRGAIAVAVFSGFAAAFTSATMVWMLNLLIPAILGLVFIWLQKGKNRNVESVKLS